MIVVNWLIKIFKALNSNQHPLEIAEGIGFGILLALIPSNNLLWWMVFLISFFLTIHQGMMIVVMAIGKLFMPFVDPMLDTLGYALLTVSALEDFYDSFFNMPLVPLLKLHNTVVMGGFALGVLLYFPILFVMVPVVRGYRKFVREKIVQSKWFKAFTSTPLVAGLMKIYKSTTLISSKFKS
ncbi:TIGR03546 family protein [Thermospira aquatica]|uniref:TIGR03546 family protein n=1 Tax=Thermospira aquatica TaxID=2828656 RepID=A0AAX3BG55_9SPIR|nr:TIGR03546 family protein [Thermospira aquatica]URA11284.1 TIGR03546 family protein [Thermospira aquatica]